MKVKKERLQVYRGKIESPQMEEDKVIATCFLRVYKVIDTIRGLGKTIDEVSIVDKILRTLFMRFNTKVSRLEEIKGLDKITMDKLHGILTTYEVRTNTYQSAKK